jgi:hypothetical protein
MEFFKTKKIYRDMVGRVEQPPRIHHVIITISINAPTPQQVERLKPKVTIFVMISINFGQ